MGVTNLQPKVWSKINIQCLPHVKKTTSCGIHLFQASSLGPNSFSPPVVNISDGGEVPFTKSVEQN